MGKKPKLTPAQGELRKHENSARRKNAKLAAEIPLFVEQVEPFTAKGEQQRWNYTRSRKSGMKDEINFLDQLVILSLRRYCRRLLGEELFWKLFDYAKRVYPSCVEYHVSFWRCILHGERVTFRYERYGEVNAMGFQSIRAAEWYECQHMTKEETYRRWPLTVDESPPHDDGGLCEELDRVFERFRDAGSRHLQGD